MSPTVMSTTLFPSSHYAFSPPSPSLSLSLSLSFSNYFLMLHSIDLAEHSLFFKEHGYVYLDNIIPSDCLEEFRNHVIWYSFCSCPSSPLPSFPFPHTHFWFSVRLPALSTFVFLFLLLSLFFYIYI